MPLHVVSRARSVATKLTEPEGWCIPELLDDPPDELPFPPLLPPPLRLKRSDQEEAGSLSRWACCVENDVRSVVSGIATAEAASKRAMPVMIKLLNFMLCWAEITL